MPPPLHHIKINSDVAIRENFAVAATVFRDSKGVVLGAIVEKFVVGSLVEGEAIAAKLGVSEASNRRWPRVILECDSSLVIKSIQSSPSVLIKNQ